MNRTYFLYGCMSIIWALTACNKADNREMQTRVTPSPIVEEKKKEEEKKTEEAPNPSQKATSNEQNLPPSVFSSSAAVDKNDSTRLLIRKANITFRAKNTVVATLAIEQLAEQFGGYVVSTALSNEEINRFINPLNQDSSLEVVRSIIKNNLVIKVPKQKLDSALRAMSTLAEKLDNRQIDTENALYSVLRNKLAQERNAKYQVIMANANRSGSQESRTNAASSALNEQANADEAKITTLELLDKVDYSQISVSVYQREKTITQVIENTSRIEEYQKGFFLEIWEALVEGVIWIKYLLLYALRFWVVALIVGGGIWAWRKYKR